MMRSQSNGNPFPEKWTLVVTVNPGKGLVEPCTTEDDARAAFKAYREHLATGVSIVTARLIPPDGEGVVITLVGAQPARV